MKILILIIDSDNLPIYSFCREIWRKYMNNFKPEINSFFIRGNHTEDVLIGDTFYCKVIDNFYPGIIKKTIKAFEYFINYDYDYLLRTNLSSFYSLNNLISFLNNCPQEKYCLGAKINSYGIFYPSGCGYILSKDIIIDIVENKNKIEYNIWDDVSIGLFLKDKYEIIDEKVLLFIDNKDDENYTRNKITNAKNIYHHYRVKNDSRDIDKKILSTLLEEIYNIK